MRSVETSGKTRKEAIQAALDQLGVELHEVKVEILDEGNRGFLGIGSRDVRVRVRIDDGGEGDVARGNDAGALLQEIIHRMGIEAEVTTEHLDNGTVRLNVESPDSAILIGRKGKTLASLQYLINRMVSTGDDPDNVERIIVDIEGYLTRRRESLEELAHRLAQRAKETNKRVRMKPLDPQERRIIHVALQDDPDVQTFSVGNAQVRSVVIEPKGYQGSDEVEAAPERGARDRGERPERGERRSSRGRRGGRRGERTGAETPVPRDNGPRQETPATRRPGSRDATVADKREPARREAGARGQEGRRGERGGEPVARRESESSRRPESRPARTGNADARRNEGGERRRSSERREGGRRGDRGASVFTPRSSALLGPSSLRPVTRRVSEESPAGDVSKD